MARWADSVEQVYGCIARRFRRPGPRRRALDCPAFTRAGSAGLHSPLERKNGWKLAERVGNATPHRLQHLLSTYQWDAGLVRDDLEEYVMERLGYAEGVLVVGETGFLKKGNKSAGVQRQYSGTAGRIEDCQVGVFLAYASAKGRTLLDRELYLPQVWVEDWEQRREAGVPLDVAFQFQIKPQLTQLMLEQAVEAGVPFGGLPGMRSTAATATCGCDWSGRACAMCWPSNATRSCGH